VGFAVASVLAVIGDIALRFLEIIVEFLLLVRGVVPVKRPEQDRILKRKVCIRGRLRKPGRAGKYGIQKVRAGGAGSAAIESERAKPINRS